MEREGMGERGDGVPRRRGGAARGGPIVNLNPIRKTINAACAVPSQMPDEPYQPQQTEEFQENEARARAATVKILDRARRFIPVPVQL